MKRARYEIETVAIFCPGCAEIIASDCGSEFWTVAELDLVLKVQCANGHESKPPKLTRVTTRVMVDLKR